MITFRVTMACWWLAMFGWPRVATAADTQEWEVESPGDFDYQIKDELLIATNRVAITYREGTNAPVTLMADRVRLDRRTGEAMAEGAVNLQHDRQRWVGERLEYNFVTREANAATFRTGLAPFYAAGVGLSLDTTNQVYTATNAVVTTDDVAEPGLKIRARYLKMVAGQSLEARHAVLYLGRVPVMYFPYYKRSLEANAPQWALTPGYRTKYGPFILSRYEWYKSEQFSGGLHLDYREKRGAGVGPDFKYKLGPYGIGELRLYYTHDDEPGVDAVGKPIDEDRYRVALQHSAMLRTNLTAKLAVYDQSDAYVIRDFFENEYKKNAQPRSYLEVNQLWPNFSLNALVQPQINDFWDLAERLPDLKLTALRQQLGVSPLYYESESSAGYFRYRFANDQSPYYAAFRGDTYHQIVLPRNFFGWLNVTPRVGGRYTYYSTADGPGALTEEHNRTVFNTGAEISTKASRIWPQARNRFWDVQGLRHIVEPSVNYVYVPSPSVLPADLPQFDTELPTYRPIPIEFPDYNAIDSIDSQNVLRLGLHNRLQTKREGLQDDLLAWALVTDWRLSPNPGQSTFADVYSDIDLKPRTWLTLTSESRFDVEQGRWRMANNTLTLRPNDTWSLALGYFYLRDDPSLGPYYAAGNNLITGRIYLKFSENWAFRMSQHFDAIQGQMQEQYYTFYRDLRSWTAALTFRVRETSNGPTDYTLAVTFSLKAFPRFALGSDSDSPSLLLGY